ncbi:MAG: glycosyl hydrolase, partial [Runella slithyformis]
MKNFFCAVFIGLVQATVAFSQAPQSDDFKNLKYRFIGPDGNRAIAIAGEAGNPNVAYIGAASGGIFKTDDAGISWKPIFDNQEVSSIGALAVSQSDPKQVWAGTGETFLIRPAHSLGNGIYKSTDAGKTWKNAGLEKTARIGRVVVHPSNPDIVYVCALGHVYGPQQERGVYRTKDGGKTWERVLFVNENTGAIDLSMDATNPDVLFAG